MKNLSHMLRAAMGKPEETRSLFDKAELRKVFERAPEHVRQACLDAFDNPTAPTSYECGRHPGQHVPVEYRGLYTFTGTCPQCKGELPLLTRYDGTDQEACRRDHDEMVAMLRANKWTKYTHPDLWPRYESFASEDDLPAWWPREAPSLGHPKGKARTKGPDGDDLVPGLDLAYEALAGVLKGRRSGAFIYGEAGVGKSMAAMRAAASARGNGVKTAVVREIQLGIIATKAKGYSEKDHDWAVEVTDELLRIPLLIIDEVGRANSWTGARGDWYEEFIDRRWKRRLRKDASDKDVLRTVFVSNGPLDDLKATRGPTVVSRIRGICGPDVFVFGPDLREVRA